MRAVTCLVLLGVIVLAGCAANNAQQSTSGSNATGNATNACGNGVPVVTTHQIGNGAGDPTANNTACGAPTVPSTISAVTPTY